jgi:hypothetical protein
MFSLDRRSANSFADVTIMQKTSCINYDSIPTTRAMRRRRYRRTVYLPDSMRIRDRPRPRPWAPWPTSHDERASPVSRLESYRSIWEAMVASVTLRPFPHCRMYRKLISLIGALSASRSHTPPTPFLVPSAAPLPWPTRPSGSPSCARRAENQPRSSPPTPFFLSSSFPAFPLPNPTHLTLVCAIIDTLPMIPMPFAVPFHHPLFSVPSHLTHPTHDPSRWVAPRHAFRFPLSPTLGSFVQLHLTLSHPLSTRFRRHSFAASSNLVHSRCLSLAPPPISGLAVDAPLTHSFFFSRRVRPDQSLHPSSVKADRHGELRGDRPTACP